MEARTMCDAGMLAYAADRLKIRAVLRPSAETYEGLAPESSVDAHPEVADVGG